MFFDCMKKCFCKIAGNTGLAGEADQGPFAKCPGAHAFANRLMNVHVCVLVPMPLLTVL